MAPVPPLKLWYNPIACSLVPHVTIIEAGLEAELIFVDFDNMTPEFVATNPKRRVPTLAMGDEIITELAAICTAIASLAPEKHLLGSSLVETARVYEWLSYLSTTGHSQSLGPLWRPERYSNDTSMYPTIREKGKGSIKDVYAYIEQKMQKLNGPYAVGRGFTVADIFLVLMYRWGGKGVGLDMDKDYPKYGAYAAAHFERQSIVEARKTHTGFEY